MPKKFLTVNEVAKLLGVTPLTIRNWDKSGKLEAYRNPVNNYRIYKTADVEDLMKSIEGSRGKTFPLRHAIVRQDKGGPEPEPPKPKTRKLEIEVL